LYGANLSRANLSGANLYGADLSSANLSRADLSSANLSGANLSRANLYGANLYGANLSRADLSSANLSYPIYQAQLGQWNIHTNKEHIRIGCMYLTVTKWLQVTEEQSVEMGLRREHYVDYMAFIKWYSKKEVSKSLIQGDAK
jgi:hypothetical protein